MTLAEVLRQEAKLMYQATEGLFNLVDDEELGWKPPSGSNWMTVGQLLHHCSTSCGALMKGLMTGDWGIPEDEMPDPENAESMLPPAESMPAVGSVAAAKAMLESDRELAYEFIGKANEDELLSKRFAPPWGGPELTLFQHLYMSIWHLGQHKGQLFYYLKLQGKNVNTMHLWGMQA